MKIKKSDIVSAVQILKTICAVKMNRRIPLYCEWEVISHCNMSCSFCSTWIRDRNKKEDASTEEALNIIEQLSELGTKMVHLSGGEPTLRNDLPELITKAKERNMIVSITTNGSASIQKMEKILHADMIRISIDGNEQFHDTIRSSPGAFNRAMETLQFLVSRKKKPLITVVYTENTSYEMLTKLADIAKSLNIQVLVNNLGRNINDESGNVDCQKSNDLSSPYFCKYIAMLCRLRKDYGNVIANPNPHLTIIRQGGLDVFGCRAMDIAISIKPDGGVSLPCNGWSKMIMKGNLREIYYGEEAMKLRSFQGKHSICKGCNIRCMGQASALLKLKGLLAIIDSYARSLL